MKRFGFTLAEVLITLGVIGIVAAMTLPALVHNYQEQEYVTRLKKSVSALEQAKIRAMDENNLDFQYMGYGGVYIQSEQEKFANYFKPYFNVLRDCATPSNNNTLCIGNNRDFYQINRKTKANQYADNTFRGFVSADGVSYFFYVARSLVIIDVNTPNKAPNSLGHDVFVFHFDKKGKLTAGWGTENVNTLEECKTVGNTCGQWVLLYENQSYRRCPDKVEYGGKTKC